jgi:hypothetical protein
MSFCVASSLLDEGFGFGLQSCLTPSLSSKALHILFVNSNPTPKLAKHNTMMPFHDTLFAPPLPPPPPPPPPNLRRISAGPAAYSAPSPASEAFLPTIFCVLQQQAFSPLLAKSPKSPLLSPALDLLLTGPAPPPAPVFHTAVCAHSCTKDLPFSRTRNQ